MAAIPFSHKLFQKKVVSKIIKYSIITSTIITVIGLVLFLFQQGSQPIEYIEFKDTAALDLSVWWQELTQGKSEAVMELGILILILIPIALVIFAMIGFFLERDYLYVFISFIVLAIIFTSMYLGASH